MVRTFPLSSTRSGEPEPTCWAYVGLARHSPVPSNTRALAFLIMKLPRLALFGDDNSSTEAKCTCFNFRAYPGEFLRQASGECAARSRNCVGRGISPTEQSQFSIS